MANTHLMAALGGALLVGLGVVLGSTLLTADSDTPPAQPTPTPSVPEAPADAGARLGASPDQLDELRREVAALDRRIGALEDVVRTERESLQPLRDLYEAWEKREPGLAERIAADPDALVDHVDGASVEVELPHGEGVARTLAASLKLDAARSSAFAREVDALMKEVRTLEERHAEVTVDGDTTSIHLAPYPDGAALERRWKDWLSANLTPEEQDHLVKQGGTNKLFGSRLGSFDRRITIRESGGGIQVKEKATAPDGNEFQTEVQGPALGREFVLAEYLHLLD